MHRCLLIVGLVVVFVWLVQLGAGAGQPAAPPQPVKAAPVPPMPPPSPAAPMVRPAAPTPPDRVWQVDPPGYGETKDAAKDSARDKAQESVVRFLNEKYPDLHWTPDASYLKDIGVIRIDDAHPSAADPRLFEAIAHVDVSDPNLHKMQEKIAERGRRSWSRRSRSGTGWSAVSWRRSSRCSWWFSATSSWRN